MTYSGRKSLLNNRTHHLLVNDSSLKGYESAALGNVVSFLIIMLNKSIEFNVLITSKEVFDSKHKRRIRRWSYYINTFDKHGSYINVFYPVITYSTKDIAKKYALRYLAKYTNCNVQFDTLISDYTKPERVLISNGIQRAIIKIEEEWY